MWAILAAQAACDTLPALGRLAQRLAQVPYKHKIGGSNPSPPTMRLQARRDERLAFFVAPRRLPDDLTSSSDTRAEQACPPPGAAR